MSSEGQKDSPSPAELCERFVHVWPADASQNEFQEIAPGCVRKVYRANPVRDRRVLTPPMLNLPNKLRPFKEIAGNRDKRTPEQLLDQVKDAIQQLLFRAHCGDVRAIATVVVAIRHSVEALDLLANKSPQKIRGVAKGLPQWPVLLSLNPQEIRHVVKHLKKLGVGSKAKTPTGPGQRRDPHNFWTRIADEAYATCRRCKHDVRLLESLCRGARRERKTWQYWGIEEKRTIYYPAETPPVLIADWQKRCKELSQPITDTNFDDWWKVVKLCVLQYWQNPRSNYRKALNIIGQKNLKTWERRELALARVKQAFRSLINP
jgi:hypothetical protein